MKIFKIIIIIITILICIGMIFYFLPIMKSLVTMQGKEEYKEKIQTAGIEGVFIIIGLEIAQIFLFVLPGEPIEILAGMCYGGFWGTILIMISVVLCAIIIYLLVGKFGRSFIYSFCNEEQIKKMENSKIFKNAKNIEFVMLLLFFIPGTPKDLLTYLAFILPIKPTRFIIISTIARFPSIISSTIAGEHIASGNIYMAIIIYSITFLLVGIVIILAKIFDKSNATNDVLETIKKEGER